MIFQHTIDKVLDGTKTQTRRLVKPGQWLERIFYDTHQHYVYQGDPLTNLRCVFGTYHRHLYPKTYAVQPGRGKVAVARIRLTDIRREDVRNISPADAVAEGFTCRTHFWLTWCKMHDPAFYKRYPTTGQISLAWDRGELAQRPAERYDAWALTFELVK